MSSTTPDGLIYWLGAASANARKTRDGLSPEILAPLIGVNNTTLRRFEQGTALPRQLDTILSAYAFFGGYEDSRALVAEGLRLWCENGNATPVPENLAQMADLLQIGK